MDMHVYNQHCMSMYQQYLKLQGAKRLDSDLRLESDVKTEMEFLVL